jgi:SAM-dependent methyltransferase
MTHNKEYVVDFWKKYSPDHIMPDVGKKFPEGWNVSKFLKKIIKKETVTEVGCGYGRLCKGFTKKQYFGFDISSESIGLAKDLYPGYQFSEMGYDEKVGETDWHLFYTVLLHVRDENLGEVIQLITSNKIIVGEIMDKKWREAEKDVPVFNRNANEYIGAFEDNGFIFVERIDKPYERYQLLKELEQNKDDENIEDIDFEIGDKSTNVSFLIFKRKGS